MRPATVSPVGYRRIALFALLSLGAIVVTGAAVRLTGSGLGCPSWPNCEPGSLVPRDASGSSGWIEFLNRVFTGVVAVAVIAAVLASRRRMPRRRDLSAWSYSLVAGVFGNALLGGLVVIFDLTPLSVAGHYLLSAVTIACGAVLYRRAGEPDGGERRPQTTPEARAWLHIALAAATAVLVLGTLVTGAGPHGGDEVADRLDLSVPDVARLHSIAAWILVGASVVAWWRVRRGQGAPELERALRRLLVVEVAQGAVGYVQYLNGVPEELVGVHVFGSVVLWALAWWAVLCAHTVDPPDRRRVRPGAVASAV